MRVFNCSCCVPTSGFGYNFVIALAMVVVGCCSFCSNDSLAAENQPDNQSNNQRDRDQPNIVIVLCDDLGYGDLSCYGHEKIVTDNIDALASSGMRFTSCYSAAPVCSPSRVGLLTGRSPNRAGVYDFIPGPKTSPDLRHLVHMRADEITITHLLKQAGYSTGMFGKWHCNGRFNSPQQPQPDAAGFDYWLGTQNNASPSHANPKNFVRNGQPVGETSGFSCQIVMDEALGWIEKGLAENKSNPFFAYVAFHEPHEPVASPPELVQQYLSSGKTDKPNEAEYFANVHNVDLAVGKLTKKLKALGIENDTIVIFTSDNGPETLNRYRRAKHSYGTPKPFRGMKLWTTEAGFRVAGIVCWPGHIEPAVSDVPVSSLDLLPTLCSIASAKIPAGLKLDGTNISPIFEGGEVKRTKPLVWAFYNAINKERIAMRHGKWKMLAQLDSGKFKKFNNLHEGNVDKVRQAKLSDFELYDLSNDAGETNNLFDPENAQHEKLKELMISSYQDLLDGSHVWKKEQ